MNEQENAAKPANPLASDGSADDLLFVDEVSTWTRIPANTLKYYRRNGTGPHSAIVGGKIRYRRGDVNAWLNAQFADTASQG
jgi:hypothetical protein